MDSSIKHHFLERISLALLVFLLGWYFEETPEEEAIHGETPDLAKYFVPVLFGILGVACYGPLYSRTRDCGVKAAHYFLDAMQIGSDLLPYVSKVLIALDTGLESNLPPILAFFGGDNVSDARSDMKEADQPPLNPSAGEQAVQECAVKLKEAEHSLTHSHEPAKTPTKTTEDHLSYDPYWLDDPSLRTGKKSAKPAAPIWRPNLRARTAPPSAAGTAMMAQKMAWRAKILNRKVPGVASQESASGNATSEALIKKKEAQSQPPEQTLSVTQLPASVHLDKVQPLTPEPVAASPSSAPPAPKSVSLNPQSASLMPDPAPNGPTLVFAMPDLDSCSDKDEFNDTSGAAGHLDVEIVQHTGYMRALEKRCSVSEQRVAELEAENAQLRETCRSSINHLEDRVHAEMARKKEEKRKRMELGEEIAVLSRKITAIEKIMTEEQKVQLTTETTSPNERHQTLEDEKAPEYEAGKSEEMLILNAEIEDVTIPKEVFSRPQISPKSAKTRGTAEKLLYLTLRAARNTSGVRKCIKRRLKISPKAATLSMAMLNAPKDARPASAAVKNVPETSTPAPRPPKIAPDQSKETISIPSVQQPRKKAIFTNFTKSEPRPAPVVPEVMLPVSTEPVLVAREDGSVAGELLANNNVTEIMPVVEPEQQPATEPCQRDRHEKRPTKHEGLAQSMYSPQSKYRAQNVAHDISQETIAVEEIVDLDMAADAAAADSFDDMDTAEGAVPVNLDIPVEPVMNPD